MSLTLLVTSAHGEASVGVAARPSGEEVRRALLEFLDLP